MTDWLPRLVARIPGPLHAKLLAGFLAIVVLLLVVGAAGLQALAEVSRRAEDLVKRQRKIAAYRQLQHDTTTNLIRHLVRDCPNTPRISVFSAMRLRVSTD